MDKLEKILFWLFAALLFFVPLIIWPFTSEVFEFNKMVLTYILTALVVGVWGVRCIAEQKFIFRRTILDIPILIFLGSQFISTILSLDPNTSWLGYYSRFNGGLFSTICYSLLYWVFVSSFGTKETLKLIYVSLVSASLVSVYAVAEHFGIDKNIWVQDVESRVFSTLGQPNWLAAWLVALLPTTWALLVNSGAKNQASKLQFKSLNFWIYFSLSNLFFWSLVFTKSRSGLLGFVVAFIIFWAGHFFLNRKELGKALAPFGIITLSLILISLISGTQYTPSISQFLNKTNTPSVKTQAQEGPALEVGGTESGTIRRIVWKGAVNVWLHYPVFGSGVETFAYSYYQYRPVEHNLVSEWDFIYNKAHNEFLNMAANSGTFGLIAYLVFIGFSIYQMAKSKNILTFGILSGYISLLATNFFGFSVVPTQLQFFLFPAFALTLETNEILRSKNEKMRALTAAQKAEVLGIVLLVSYLLISISRYWYGDTLYAKGKSYNAAKQQGTASSYLERAVRLQPNQAIYHAELAGSYTALALSAQSAKDDAAVKKYIAIALKESEKATSLSPANLNLKRARFGVFVMLSAVDPNYLTSGEIVLKEAIDSAPTDAKLYYNLGLIYARTGKLDAAIETLKKTIELKSNYRDARLAYAYLLIDKKEFVEAKTQLTYILTYIDPNDSLSKQTLESLK